MFKNNLFKSNLFFAIIIIYSKIRISNLRRIFLYRFIVFLVWLLIIFLPQNSFAILNNIHTNETPVPEVPHFLFLFISLYIILKRYKPVRRPNTSFKKSIIFFFLWNLLSLLIIYLEKGIPPQNFSGNYLIAEDLIHYLWYAGNILKQIFLFAAILYFFNSIITSKNTKIGIGG